MSFPTVTKDWVRANTGRKLAKHVRTMNGAYTIVWLIVGLHDDRAEVILERVDDNAPKTCPAGKRVKYHTRGVDWIIRGGYQLL